MLYVGKLLYNETTREVSESITSASLENDHLVIYTTRGYYQTNITGKDIDKIKKIRTFGLNGLKIKIGTRWRYSQLDKDLHSRHEDSILSTLYYVHDSLLKLSNKLSK